MVDLVNVGRKPYLVVSDARRNDKLPSVLAARITTSIKPPLASIVELPSGEPLVGRVLCYEIIELWHDETPVDVGALSPSTMKAVGEALKAAFGLS